jgi:hypothetical protein
MRSCAVLASLLLLVPRPPAQDAPPAAEPPTLGRLELAETATPLLADHLALCVPTVAISQARGHNIMAAPEPDERETRIVVDAGEQRLVLMVRELHRSPGEPFAEHVAKSFEPLKAEHESLAIAPLDPPVPGLTVLLVQPAKVDTSATAVPLFWAEVAHPDGSVQDLGFYVNPAGAKDLPAAQGLARRMLATLRAGSRKVSSVAHEQALGGTLRIDLPADAAYSCQQGVDFVVHHVDLVVPVGDFAGHLGVFIGGYPEKPKDSTLRVPASILGKPAEWLLTERDDDGDHLFSANVIVPLPSGGDGEVMHLFVAASSKDVRDRLMQIAGTVHFAR